MQSSSRAFALGLVVRYTFAKSAEHLRHPRSAPPHRHESGCERAGDALRRPLDDQTSTKQGNHAGLAFIACHWGSRTKPPRPALAAVRDAAIERVQLRGAEGGHAIPEEVIRRRFAAGRGNFEILYKPLADAWALHEGPGRTPGLLDWNEKR